MNKKYVIIFILLILSTSLTGCFINPPIPNIPEWTVMIYLDADNNLESAGINDINEMEMIGSSSDVNIVVQADRIPGYDISNSDWTNTRRYYITQDFDPFQINSQFNDLGELNMGDPQTLVDFASWAITEYPAEKYLLVIWNHGGGFRSPAYTTKDIAWDYTSGRDSITMPELEDALFAISTQMGKNIDIVGMDACLMAMTEVAYQIKNYADIMVASEENEPGDGWPYDTILAQLVSNPLMSPKQLAADIVDKYIFSYSYPSYEVTQSAIDLSYMDTLVGQLSSLAQTIKGDSITPSNKYIIAAYNSQYYSQSPYSSEKEFIDLYDFCNKLLVYSNSSNVKNIALNIQQIFNSAVINSGFNGVSVSGSKGLSIYFPYYSGYINIKYNDTNFARDTKWDEMLSYLGY